MVDYFQMVPQVRHFPSRMIAPSYVQLYSIWTTWLAVLACFWAFPLIWDSVLGIVPLFRFGRGNFPPVPIAPVYPEFALLSLPYFGMGIGSVPCA